MLPLAIERIIRIGSNIGVECLNFFGQAVLTGPETLHRVNNLFPRMNRLGAHPPATASETALESAKKHVGPIYGSLPCSQTLISRGIE